MTVVSMNYLLEAGVHFGHQRRRWNPKMKEYIFTSRDDIYIIDLQIVVKKLEEAYEAIKEIAANEGKFLFVGTKKQAQEAIEENAQRVEMFYVHNRWLGGTLTNFKTIRSRIKRMEEIEKMEADNVFEMLPKKEVIKIRKEYEKLDRNLGGIREMKRLPQALIVVDPMQELIAIREAKNLGIPIFGIVDTNCDPDLVDYVIPGNDDAVRSVKLLVGVLTNAIAEVTEKEMIDYVSEDEAKAQRSDDRADASAKRPAREKTEERDEKEETKTIKVKKEIETQTEVKTETKVEEKLDIKEEKVEEDLSSMTVTALRELAKERGLKGYSKLKKEELLSELSK